MRVLAVNQFYAPDTAATAQLLTQLCEDLVGLGDEVTAVASRGAYLGGGLLPAREVLGGVEVVRPWSTRLGKRTNLHRLSDYLSFWATSVARVAAERRPDVILALTTPPMIAAGVGGVARARGVPFVTWVQDVYPEAAVELEALGAEQAVTHALRAVARLTHRLTHTTVVLSERMAQRMVAQGQAPERIRVVHNWSDGEAVRPLAHADNPFRREHAREGEFLVVYSGNIGKGHDVETLLGAARALHATHPEVRFLFIGDGVRRAEAERLAEGLSTVRFLPYQPFEALAQSLSAADVHLVSLRDRLEGLLVPSKLYGILAAGRPLVFVGPADSEVARVIRAHDVGWELRVGDVDGLARTLAGAAADRADTARRGAVAREVFERDLDRPIAVQRWREVLAEAAGTAATAGTTRTR